MAYFYRIILDDETRKDVVPQSLNGKKLSAFDSFSMSDDFTKFLEDVCNQLNIPEHSISDIKIVKDDRRSREIEYNLLEDNPYFADVFSKSSVKQVNEYNYKAEREIISPQSESYQEMRDYVFNQLKRNSNNFLNDIYKYPNKFKEILEKYAKSYESNDFKEEDYHYLYELETTIKHHLTIYKIYRSMATKRYQYEKYGRYDVRNNNNKINKDDKDISAKILEQRYTNLNTVSHRTKEYNEKYDEFIEPDEYGQMNGYTGGKVL